jgi:hypothetical protein
MRHFFEDWRLPIAARNHEKIAKFACRTTTTDPRFALIQIRTK